MLRPRGFTQYEIRTYVLAQTRSLHIFVHFFPNVNDTNKMAYIFQNTKGLK